MKLEPPRSPSRPQLKTATLVELLKKLWIFKAPPYRRTTSASSAERTRDRESYMGTRRRILFKFAQFKACLISKTNAHYHNKTFEKGRAVMLLPFSSLRV